MCIRDREDGFDNNCDDNVDEGFDAFDNDGDGYSVDDGDCDDADLWTYPSAHEFCDEVDNNCNDTVDEGCDDILDESPVAVDKGGCATTTAPSGLWLLAAGIILLRRRRWLPLLAMGTIGCSFESNLQSSSRSLLIDEPLIDLGIVPVGVAQNIEIDLVSVGAGSVNLSDVEMTADPETAFALDGWPETLTSGEQGVIALSFAPADVGAHRAELIVRSDAAEETQLVYFRAYAALSSVQVFPSRLDFGTVDALSLIHI